MNIVYISWLSGNKSAGLSYSVPVQIESQSKIDKVLWYNLDLNYQQDTDSNIKCFNSNDYPNFEMNKLPAPFNNPDIVVFEGFYFTTYCKIAKDLKIKGIPYVIIPRGSLTMDAQSIKKMKKKVANFLFFNKFASNASAIQYLTKQEYKSSGEKWNKNVLIIPNGTAKKSKIKVRDSNNSLKGVFIGRLDIYHKGIDLLIKACATLRSELIENNIKIDIYGSDQNGSKRTIKKLIVENNLEEFIFVKDGIYDIEKENVILNSDFFVLTSRFEGHPMGLIEALSYGIPCLVTTGTNMAEEIELGNAGWRAEISIESVTGALKRLIYEKNDLIEKGQNAIKVSEKYDWDALAHKTHQLYRQLTD